jgi:hypothetical protein
MLSNQPCVLGNHDITLDAPFFREKESKWKWPEPQDPAMCRKLLTDSPSITYLEHEAATIYLPKRGTCFKIFGSPYSPGQRGWAFQYWGADEAETMWKGIETDTDIVITHTPAQGHCDAATKDDRSGCSALTRRLEEIRPMMHVCGHIHEARGVERVRWSTSRPPHPSTVEAIEHWADPGTGSKKISLLDLTAKGKGGRGLDNAGRVKCRVLADSLGGGHREGPLCQPEFKSTSSLEDGALNEAVVWSSKTGGAMECRGASDVGYGAMEQHSETAMINAAFLGPRIAGKAMEFNKPIVVDVELPVWEFASSDVQ